MSKKKVLITIDNVRIIQFNDMNLAVERYEDVFIPVKKVTEKRWVFHGYTSTVLSALTLIHRKELLIDSEALSDLKSHLKAVRESNVKLLEVMKE